MKQKIKRIIGTLRRPFGLDVRCTYQDLCHTTVTVRLTRTISMSDLRIQLRVLAAANGLECETEHNPGCSYVHLTFYRAASAVAHAV